MTAIVLDASAVLAVIQGEAGADQIEPMMADAVISTVNLSEVVGKLVDKGLSDAEIDGVIDALSLKSEDFTGADALRAGTLRRLTAPSGLSLGDRACLSLAERLGAKAVTTDRAWGTIDIGIAIEVARPPS